MLDENDNAPIFERPSNQDFLVREDTPIGTTIARVKAYDEDARYPNAFVYVSYDT